MARAAGAGRIPYRLFALSNLASLLALALYPTLVEPYLTLRTQRVLWSCGFVCFAALAERLPGVCATSATPPSRMRGRTEDEPPASLRSKCLWLLLPMVASMQLCAVTSYLTANIAAIPLLWILPLAAYLITLIIAFEYARFVPRPLLTRLLAVMLAGLAYMLAKADAWLPAGIGIAFFLIEMFLACLYCHVEAYALRPRAAKDLTVFYLMFAAGGAIGSFLIGYRVPADLLFQLRRRDLLPRDRPGGIAGRVAGGLVRSACSGLPVQRCCSMCSSCFTPPTDATRCSPPATSTRPCG